ncbi:ABC transporter permease [Brevibacterium oceani]|uniref:ABC transporter permease n=1 Tax=Brevibacterium oceani TaxID=358099 RepID=UPI0015E7494D|nr:ABC transporter permease [Brevibacterium oceani]
MITAVIILFVIAPLAVVIVSSFTTEGYLNFPPQGFSLKWYGEAFGNDSFTQSLITSALLGLSTTAVSVICGVPAAFGVSRLGGRLGFALEQIFLSPLTLPAVILGLGALFVLTSYGYNGTFVGGLLAHVIVASPFVLRSVLAGLQSLDRRLEDAAHSLGAGSFRTFFDIVLPSIRGSIISGAIFAFVISFDEAVVTLFLTSSRFETLPVTIFSYVQYSNDPSVAAISSVLVCISVVIVFLSTHFSTKEV